MNMRRANKEDATQVLYFIQELEEINLDEALFKQYFEQNLSNNENIYLVATFKEAVIGFVSCHGQILLHHLAKVFEIQELFVKKEFRGFQVGQTLITELENILKANGNQFLEVTANIKRENTHAFYARCGFVYTHKKFTKRL